MHFIIKNFGKNLFLVCGKQYNYKIPTSILINLTKRWFDKSYSVQQMRKDIDNEKFLDWDLSFDKNDHQKYVKDNMKPFEVLFFDVGDEILKNISGYLVKSDKDSTKNKKRCNQNIKTVKNSKDVKKINTLRLQLDKLNSIGGLSSIVPSEGIVFKYKGKTYKFTHLFVF